MRAARGVAFAPMRDAEEHERTADAFLEAAYRDETVLDGAGARVDLFPHSVDRAAGEALRELARAEAAQRTIEVGLALGLSAVFLGQAVLERGGRHVAIDPFQQESWNGAGLRTLRDAGLGEVVEVIEEESQLALPRLVSEGREFDLGFVDGDHRFEGVFLDLYYMTRLVRPGGVIVVDDMWMPAVRMAVAYVERNLGATLEPKALPGGFRWRRRMFGRGVPRGSGEMAVVRLPSERRELRWDEFVAPC
jgi:predicted O-methyltransferase YrrM